MNAARETRAGAREALICADPGEKVALTRALAADPGVPDPAALLRCNELPGRPGLPRLVPPQQVPRRRPGSLLGRAALLHAIAHIEFNAINLALDAVVRFPNLPPAFYLDWLRVAGEEAQHYTLLVAHLATLGHAYGDFLAHDGLWDAARKTTADPLARMGLVPRVLEARGLDVTPGLQARLRTVGDTAAAAILDLILRDEIGHVAVGNRWYEWLCAQRGVAPRTTFAALCVTYGQSPPRAPFNVAARLAGGFSREELADWAG
ncbi:MAG: ferritin-like domain-containing protein [Gammaproteobacteria bacterium]|nr:ferritin-like domain-containing protein [Gammaproteobacteria bacterium]